MMCIRICIFFAVFFVRGSLLSLQNHHPQNDLPSPFLCASPVEEQRVELQFCCGTALPLRRAGRGRPSLA